MYRSSTPVDNTLAEIIAVYLLRKIKGLLLFFTVAIVVITIMMSFFYRMLVEDSLSSTMWLVFIGLTLTLIISAGVVFKTVAKAIVADAILESPIKIGIVEVQAVIEATLARKVQAPIPEVIVIPEVKKAKPPYTGKERRDVRRQQKEALLEAQLENKHRSN